MSAEPSAVAVAHEPAQPQQQVEDKQDAVVTIPPAVEEVSTKVRLPDSTAYSSVHVHALAHNCMACSTARV